MKKIHPFIIVLAFFSSCKTIEITVPVDFTNYEVQALEQGKQGTALFKVFSYDYSVEEATQRAKFDAVHAILFKGIKGSNQDRPMDKNGYNAHQDYYDRFFGLYKIKTTEAKLKEGKIEPLIISQTFNAPYRMFVQISNDGSVDPNDRFKVGNKYKVGVIVSVDIAQLRKHLETDGIIRGLSDGF